MNHGINFQNSLKKNRRLMDYMTVCLMIMFMIQTIWLILQAVLCGKYYLGYDSSANLLFDFVTAKERTLFPKEFYGTTTQFYAPLESFIFSLCGNLFVAHGMGTIIHIAIILYFVYRIVNILAKKEDVKFIFFLVGNMLICPYDNPTQKGYGSYADNMMYPVGFYVSFVTFGVFLIWLYLLFENNNDVCVKDRGIIGIGLVLLTLRLVTSFEYITITVVVPLVLCIFLKMVVTNDFMVLRSKQSKMMYCVCGLAGSAIILNRTFIAYENISMGMNWISSGNYISNFLGVIAAFLDIASALPKDDTRQVMCVWSIEYVMGLTIVIALTTTLFISIRNIKKKTQDNMYILPFICIVLFDVFFYSLIDSDYSGTGFASRYILMAFISSFFILAVILANLSDKMLVKNFCTGIVIMAIAIITLMSDISRYENRQDTSRLNTIKAIVDEIGNGAKLVYIVGGENFWDARYMRCWDPKVVYKDIWSTGELWHWGDYSYCEEAAEYQGPYLVFCNKESLDALPTYVQNDIEKVGEWDIYDIFYGEGTVYDFSTKYELDINYDYPYSPSVTPNHLSPNDIGEYISDGTEDIILFGPNHMFKRGSYNFELEYEVEADSNGDMAGTFDLVKNESEIMDVVDIKPDNNGKVGFYNVELDGKTWVQYRVGEHENVKMKIKKVIVSKN